MIRPKEAWEIELWARGLRQEWWRAALALPARSARPVAGEADKALPDPRSTAGAPGAGLARKLPLPGGTGRPVPARRP